MAISDLRVAYGPAGRQAEVLRGVSLTLHAGELLGLVGPNGSGKTTLIRAVTRGVKSLSGEISILGEAVASLSQRELARRVAVVPQAPLLPDGFSVLETVLAGRTPHLRLLENEGQRDCDAAARAMRRTQTWELRERLIGELSGGERQRVVVARALAQETPILLLDEPTAHLDIGHQAAMLELMRTLCREEGKAALAVVHDLTLASQFCDRLVVLGPGGTVAAVGEAGEVLSASLLSKVYGASASVFPHPKTGRPVVAPHPEGS